MLGDGSDLSTHTIKLPVWHREQDLRVAEQYVRAAVEISDHHEELP
ncbi:hypothetical protein ACFYUY_06615 [Kitasatospora sp. NPDC004745]